MHFKVVIKMFSPYSDDLSLTSFGFTITIYLICDICSKNYDL